MQITISWSPPTDPMHAIESSLHAYEIGSNSNTLSKDQEKIFQATRAVHEFIALLLASINNTALVTGVT